MLERLELKKNCREKIAKIKPPVSEKKQLTHSFPANIPGMVQKNGKSIPRKALGWFGADIGLLIMLQDKWNEMSQFLKGKSDRRSGIVGSH